MKRLLAAGLMLMALAGCAGDPDATLLGVVMVPPGAVPGGAPLSAPAVAQGKPNVVPASAPAQPATVEDGKPEYLYDPDSPNKVVSNKVNPIAYADPNTNPNPNTGTDRLKTSDEVLKTEAELRTLARRNSDADERGLWNAKIRDLLAKRDSHVDNAIKKIEETGSN